MDLHLDLDDRRGRQRGLEEALRGAIRTGTLLPGTRLPSSRSLAADLGVARATVVGAYEQLTAEGFLAAERGSGTRVALTPLTAVAPPPAAVARPAVRLDFVPGEPDLTMFPRADWAASVRAVLRTAAPDTFGYGEPGGLLALRHALASYLGRARAVVADADSVFVFSGFSDALAALAAVLAAHDGRPAATDEPGLPPHAEILRRAGMKPLPIAVDDDGMVVDALTSTDAGLAVTTPAHQYPLGATLASARRGALVDWARSHDAWIVEDDYDGEFRYDRQSVGSLQGLAPDRVVYAGTASKSIAPGVGVGWLVLPRPLVEPMAEHLRLRVTTSTIEQAALAHFIETGRLDRHLRRMRPLYRRRRDQLLALLAAEAPAMRVRGIAAGLHVTAEVASADVERELTERAAASSFMLFPLSTHYRGTASRHGFVLGYTRSAEHAFGGALRRLKTFLRGTRDLLG